MAKKKTRVLWLCKDRAFVEIYKHKPKWTPTAGCWGLGVKELYRFCIKSFEIFCPALKLRMDTKCKLKLTQLKNGIKLEKVK